MTLYRAIGLMSGTSMDGIDVALIESDGETVVRFGPTAEIPYDEADRAMLRAAIEEARTLRDRRARPPALAIAEAMITRRHVEAVERFIAREGLHRDMVDIIGFHGQTVLHRPEDRLTIQIGDGQALADAIGRPVAFDMRAADIAAGGQGAPLVPVFHRALVAARGSTDPVAVLNLGGVGNVTYVGPDGALMAFDTGPGNALIDDLMRERTGEAMDPDGRMAGAGVVDQAALAQLLDHAFFGKKPPKSLDRNAFSRSPVAGLATPDAAATLTAFTVESVARALDWFPESPATWIVCGGGARNPTLLAGLARRLNATVTTADAVGWSSAMMEAQAFGYLALRAWRGLSLTFPMTTAAPQPLTGGVIVHPRTGRPA